MKNVTYRYFYRTEQLKNETTRYF